MICLLAFLVLSNFLCAQTATISGVITDETGAIIPGASVAISGAVNRQTVAGDDGNYIFRGLPRGNYSVTASAPQLMLPQPMKIRLAAGGLVVNLQLKVQSTEQKVSVEDNARDNVSTAAGDNASAVVIRGKDLDALADNPDDLAADLQALAGPSAGPNGGEIFIDGFSGGQLPSKDSIREIRINQNPFSPEYDKMGLGRIEIFTKPGTDKLKGTFYYNFAHDALNSRNPYAAQKAPFLLKEYGGSVSGPLGKKASYFLDVRRDSIDNGAIINGSILDPDTLRIISPYTDTFLIPQRRITVTPRVDWQATEKHTLVARYSYFRADVAESGVGSFNLPSRAVHSQSDSHTIQLTDTAVVGTAAINETRFQYWRLNDANMARMTGPAIQVLGAFNDGGAPIGAASDTNSFLEMQNNTTITRGSHAMRFGVRLRGQFLSDTSPTNFNGTFTFGGGLAPADPLSPAGANQPMVTITSLERLQRTLQLQRLGMPAEQIRALGGGATQFTLSAGTPSISASQWDAGVFFGDEWRVRPNLNVSYGIRYENQTNISSSLNLAPRIGFAWAPGQTSAKTRPKSVIRAGFGIFYDRFTLANTVAVLRYNGVVQRQYVVDNPNFYPQIPTLAMLEGQGTSQTVQKISNTLRSPYLMQSAIAFERQLPWRTSVAVTYANAHGLHLLRSRNVNSPLTGVYPVGGSGPLFLTESSGLYNQSQIITNVNSKVNSKVSLFGSYVWNRARSNTDGVGTFPANPYSDFGEYGRASTDIHNRGTLAGTITTLWDIRLNPLLTMESGPPFDITVGRDLFGTTLFNGRPGIATDASRPGLVRTVYGLLDPNPTANEVILGRNYGRGPGAILFNCRVSKTFSFGLGEGHEAPTNIPGGGERRGDTSGVFTGAGQSGPAATRRRYNVIISMSIRNILNHNNPGPIIGNITSPLFGQANQPAGASALGGTNFSESANNRRLELQTRFTF